ncbi:MAG: hypothetical protein S4CHLAM2_15140 [Chlamydiales bacterium]|nr:hypothetical protein [Chlamydiales bacterium]
MIKLTTIIPNYNYAHFLEEAVLSIATHEGSNEILIIDDASSDGSQDLIVQLAKKHTKIRYYFKKKNEGIAKTANQGLGLAKGEYVHLFASDDMYLPGTLPTILEHIDQFPEVSFFCSDFAYFSDISDIQVKKQLNTCQEFLFFSPQKIFQLFQRTNFWIPGHTVVAKKSIYAKYFPMDEQFGSISDWFIHHTMALKEGVGYIPRGLIAMRQHAQSFSSNLSKERKRKMWLYLLDVLEKNPDQYARLYKSGILRMIGIKAIYKELLKNPRFWKYLFPMIKREIVKSDGI